MMIAIWGKDGTGKSTLAEAVGLFYTKKRGLALVIDSDTTQPTLTGRIPVEQHKRNGSIGQMLASPSVSDVAGTFHQHPKYEGLFFAGTTCKDNYLSYESGMEQSASASEYLQQCKAQVDAVVVDCSGQKDDPFVPVSLMQADRILLLFSPTVEGVAWVMSVHPLLERLGVMGKTRFVASQVHKHQDIRAVEKTLGRKVNTLPFDRSLHQLRCEGRMPTDGRYYRLAVSLVRDIAANGGRA
jgi:MinD-like ATPase involved in chromosome partitioning or flagellar assembly